MGLLDDNLQKTAGHLLIARRVTVLAGSGVSAASGVPTFRGTHGLWKSFRPEDLATPQAFERNPNLVWEWYDLRRQQIARCEPNRAHRILARWSIRFPAFRLITQNVDDLDARAGTANVVRYHGSIWELRCTAGCRPPWEDRRAPIPDLPPRCDACGGLARPGVVWFGEAIPEAAVAAARRAAACDVCLSVGTSALVYPAAGLIQDAAGHGAVTIEINPEATSLSGTVDLAIRQPAEEALDAIEILLEKGPARSAGPFE